MFFVVDGDRDEDEDVEAWLVGEGVDFGDVEDEEFRGTVEVVG